MKFSPVSRFFDWPIIKTKEKLKKSALNMFLVVNKARRAGMFLEKIKISVDKLIICSEISIPIFPVAQN
jgi:hypothetical protein